MNVGMLWFDNSPAVTLEQKIDRAARYYERKYGQAPNLAFVNPSMLPSGATRAGKIDVRPNRTVLPNHIWIGVNT
jgi:hypothetical protein